MYWWINFEISHPSGIRFSFLMGIFLSKRKYFKSDFPSLDSNPGKILSSGTIYPPSPVFPTYIWEDIRVILKSCSSLFMRRLVAYICRSCPSVRLSVRLSATFFEIFKNFLKNSKTFWKIQKLFENSKTFWKIQNFLSNQ